MNNKLLLQDLTDQLAEAGKIKKKDAEEFLRAFFKISEDALFEDGIVKINGLGTLKLVLVDARKSVNVTTGEEFEIREHHKVSFIPDVELKNAVNQPYAHLEPVELDGGVESISAVASEKKTVVAKEKEPTKKKETKGEVDEKIDSPNGPRKSKWSMIGWILFFALIAIFGAWSWISNLKHNREEAEKTQEIAKIDSLEADANLQSDLAALAKENASDSTGTSTTDDSLEAVVQSVANEPGAAKPAAEAEVAVKPAVSKPTVAASKPTVAPVKQASPAVKTAAPAPKPTATVAKVTTPVAKPATSSAKPATPITKPATTAAKPIETKTAVASKPAAAQAKVSVAAVKPTTATTTPTTTVKATEPPKTTTSVEYIATVVLKPGDRLNLLSLKYYGDKIFWVYIYQANKSVIPNPDNVPAGTTIRIPKPDPKLIDPKNEGLVAKAKALQLQYIGAQ